MATCSMRSGNLVSSYKRGAWRQAGSWRIASIGKLVGTLRCMWVQYSMCMKDGHVRERKSKDVRAWLFHHAARNLADSRRLACSCICGRGAVMLRYTTGSPLERFLHLHDVPTRCCGMPCFCPHAVGTHPAFLDFTCIDALTQPLSTLLVRVMLTLHNPEYAIFSSHLLSIGCKISPSAFSSGSTCWRCGTIGWHPHCRPWLRLWVRAACRGYTSISWAWIALVRSVFGHGNFIEMIPGSCVHPSPRRKTRLPLTRRAVCASLLS